MAITLFFGSIYFLSISLLFLLLFTLSLSLTLSLTLIGHQEDNVLKIEDKARTMSSFFAESMYMMSDSVSFWNRHKKSSP